VSAPASPRRASERGFTLLEVLVALAILGTAVVVAIQGVSQGLRLLKAAGDQQQAIIVADQKAREVLVPVEGTERGTEGRFSWERTARVLQIPDLTPADAAPQWRMFEISVVVTWDAQRRLEVATQRTVPATSDPTEAAEPFASQAAGGTSSTSGRSTSSSSGGSTSPTSGSSTSSSGGRSGSSSLGGSTSSSSGRSSTSTSGGSSASSGTRSTSPRSSGGF
jgi:type II secretion system protein I